VGNIKDRVISLLTFHGEFNPAVQTNPSQLELIAKHLKEEIHAVKAAMMSCLDAKRLCVAVRGHKKVHQEGALGALPQGYSTNALRVASANKARWLQNQDAFDLLAATQGQRMTTSALSWWKAVRLVPTTGRFLLPFLLFLLSRLRLKDPSLVSLPLSESRCSHSYLPSCQHWVSLPPWLSLLLFPMQVPCYLLPPDRRVQQMMRHKRESCVGTALCC
jgi:hypothetical protein